MQINLCKLLGLPVFTESNVHLGKVCDATVNLENNLISNYQVRHGFFRRRILFIAPSQVISISSIKMVVSDALLKDPALSRQQIFSKNNTLNPATSPISEN